MTKINCLIDLGVKLSEDSFVDSLAQMAHYHNNWFLPEMVKFQLSHYSTEFLKENKLSAWLQSYNLNGLSKRTVGFILPGNIPAVGFHDILCGIVSGHNLQIKLSSKDDIIIPELLDYLFAIDGDLKQRIKIVDRLDKCDAVIATGSTSSQDYFQKYFGNKPYIARGHRNAIGVIHGDETDEEILELADDVFMYFGLGCRNVSKLFVPKDYDVTRLLMLWEKKYAQFVQHSKYMNNYDYNKTMLLMNRITHLSSAILHLFENPSIHSRISSLHYERYDSISEVVSYLNSEQDNIQCVVSNKVINGVEVTLPGKGQKPALNDYADHVDTLEFLTQLK